MSRKCQPEKTDFPPIITPMEKSLTDTTIRNNSLYGILSILLWSTTIAFSRSLTEQLGTFTAAALIYTLAGLLGLLYLSLQPGGINRMRQVPRNYLLGCGALFIVYISTLYFAVGMAANRTQVLTIGLINYLWPGLSLVFSIPVLGRKARATLPVGIIIALVGIWLANTNGSGLSIQGLLQDHSALLPYGLALVAAVSWGLYSNLSRRWGGDHESGAVPLFLFASGMLLALLRVFTVETAHWSVPVSVELIYMALFPGLLAYILWDIAVRKGEIVLVASLSYLTPLLSTLISTLVLNIKPGPVLWLGAGLVIAGALICNASMIDPEKQKD